MNSKLLRYGWMVVGVSTLLVGFQNFSGGGKKVRLEGELEVLHIHNTDKSSHYEYSLIDKSGKKTKLKFNKGKGLNLATGAKVRVSGVESSNVLALDDSGASNLQVLALPPPNTFGAQSTVVFLVNFQDDTSQPFSPTQARSTVFTDASNQFLEMSYQQTWLTGDVFGWYTIPISKSNCSMGTVSNYAEQAALAQGVDLSKYQRRIYVFVKAYSTGCNFTGIAGTYIWFNGGLNAGSVVHEMGHVLGLDHSKSLNCSSGVVSGDCSVNEYGDFTDAMGAGVRGHYNAYQKERLGWLNYGISPPITTVEASGTYTIDPYELQNLKPKALKILKSVDSVNGQKSWYYVELRRPLGADSGLSLYPNIQNGVFVHSGTDQLLETNFLLDMTPNSSSTDDFADGTLNVGQSFTDPASGMVMTVLSVDNTGASIDIKLGQTPICTRANPKVTISPSQSLPVAAGVTTTFNMTMTNMDSLACGPSVLAPRAGPLPSGWQGGVVNYYSADYFANPGKSVTVSLSVKPPATAAPGSYPITPSSTNTVSFVDAFGNPTYTDYTGTTSATVVVSSDVCIKASPSLVLTPSQSAGLKPGAEMSYDLKLTDRNSSACGSTVYYFNTNIPGGLSYGSVSPTSITLSPGASTSASLNVGSNQLTLAGSYTITTKAIDQSNSLYSASGSVVYTVAASTTCARSNPSVSLNSSQSNAVAPGTPVLYSLTIWNNDNSLCPSSIFNLSEVVPSGWSVTSSASSFNLNPGTSGSATLTLTSPATTQANTYYLKVSVANSGVPGIGGYDAEAYTVATTGTCIRANPTVSMTPSASASVAPGTAVSYSISVKNNDSSYCSSSIFNLSKIVPSGWSSSLASSSLSVGAGAISSTTLTVTSPTTTTSGTYNLSATATNSSATTYTGSASASYSVASVVTCSRANPTVTMSPATSASVAPGTAVSYSVSVKNNDSSGCSSSSFNLSRTVPSGWSSSLSSSSLSLSPGASSSATLTVTSATTAVAGSYSLSASAVNSSATSYSGSASASYSVASVASLSAAVGTDKSIYLKGDSVLVTASVSSGGVAISGASVSISITKPNGSVVNASVVTDTSGRAVYKLRLNRKAPAGTYQVKVNASSGGQAAVAATSFGVQ